MTDDEIIEVVRAHKEGKQIQFKLYGDNWSDIGVPSWNFKQETYRIKPKPQSELREWWAEIPEKGVGQIFTDSSQLTKGGELVRVREVSDISNLGRVASTTAEPNHESSGPRKPREWLINVLDDRILGGASYGKTCGVAGRSEQIHVREVIE